MCLQTGDLGTSLLFWPVLFVFQMQVILDWDSGAICSASDSPTYWLNDPGEIGLSLSLIYSICKMNLEVVISVNPSEL